MAEASEADVESAVRSAKAAFETGPWATFTGAQRARCLNKLADLIDDHAEELAYLESLCSGRPYSMVLRGDMGRVAGVFRCTFLQMLRFTRRPNLILTPYVLPQTMLVGATRSKETPFLPKMASTRLLSRSRWVYAVQS